MSIRNMDADLAANKLNELFHLHRYEDCVLFLNRLTHNTIQLVISQISIDMYLSRLPYTIEIFEALYAKTFIIDPDNFPIRNLAPERLIDKMVAYFSLLSNQDGMEPIDGARLLDSFENVIRVISYVQPNLYSRLLYFKYAIDKGLLRFENDLALYNSHLKMQSLEQFKSPMVANTEVLSGGNQSSDLGCGTLSKRSGKMKASALANALLISRASNMQTCEGLRDEIVRTVSNCDKALSRLNEFISQLKSQKVFKDVQFYLNQQQDRVRNQHLEATASGKENAKTDDAIQDNPGEESLITTSSKKLTTHRKSSRSNSSKGLKSRSESVNGRFSVFVDPQGPDETDSLVGSSTICQDFIQNRLYLNKAMMNTVDKYLETIKLHQTLAELCEKIDLDKEILLVFTHLKQEEKYLSSLEPLQPLFRRYSLGFERCIQIWRRKCSADSLLLFNDRFNYQSKPCTANQQNQSSKQPFDQLYVCDPEDSNNIDRVQSSFTSSAEYAAKMPSKAYEFMQNELIQGQMITSAASEAANAVAHGSNNCLKRSSTDVFSKYSNVVNSCLNNSISSGSMSRNQKIRARNIYKQEPNTQSSLKTLPSKDEEIQRSIYELPPCDSSSFERVILGETLPPEKHTPKATINNQESSEVERLKAELSQAKNTIEKLKQNETELKEKLQDKINEQLNDSSIQVSNGNLQDMSESSAAAEKSYTNELILLFNNLNKHYRLKAYESLDTVKEIANMQEFKLKLLFSVVILAYRYCKFYIKDLKRKVKTLLQICDRSSLPSSQKSSQAPTIVVHGDIDQSTESEIEAKKRKRHCEMRLTSTPQPDTSNQIIENALNKYLHMVTLSKTFDLNKINDEVKEQLWNTLYDYPLKECLELNSYINEAVKTCWALINHQPLIKLGFSDLKFYHEWHERADMANQKSENILQFIWPSLVDSSSNACLTKGIVIT